MAKKRNPPSPKTPRQHRALLAKRRADFKATKSLNQRLLERQQDELKRAEDAQLSSTTNVNSIETTPTPADSPTAPAARPSTPDAPAKRPLTPEQQDLLKSLMVPPDSKTALPRNAIGFETFYNLMHEDRGFRLPLHLVPVVHALMDDRIKNLLIVLGPGAGKSALLSIVYPAFELGHDPTLTTLGISAGENLIQGFMTAVAGWIENSLMWRTIFPFVAPDKDQGWSTERGIFVKGHPPGDPDASYFATGLTSKSLTGKHGRIILGDDLHDKENSASAEACSRVREFYYSQIIGRADPRGARFVFAGRRWHEEDIYGHLKSTGDWVVMELPAMRKGAAWLYWDITVPAGMNCCFNELARAA